MLTRPRVGKCKHPLESWESFSAGFRPTSRLSCSLWISSSTRSPSAECKPKCPYTYPQSSRGKLPAGKDLTKSSFTIPWLLPTTTIGAKASLTTASTSIRTSSARPEWGRLYTASKWIKSLLVWFISSTWFQSLANESWAWRRRNLRRQGIERVWCTFRKDSCLPSVEPRLRSRALNTIRSNLSTFMT